MPAKRKTTAETQAALRRLFAARNEWERNQRAVWPPYGMERTRGYTLHRRLPGRMGTGGGEYRNPEPRVWVFRKRMRVRGTLGAHDADPLVTALWQTLPKEERRRSRLFVHCAECPVRFTKKGALADAHRCGRVGRYSPPTQKERVSADVRASTNPPRLEPRDEFEEGVAQVWDDLSTLHRRTLYAWLRPAVPHREWALEGAPSPEAFDSRVRTAERAAARALAARQFPDRDYSITTRGRRGFDYERFWADWYAHLGVGQTS